MPAAGSNDRFLPMSFPDKGVDLTEEFSRQPAGTTPVGQNVRLNDTLEARDRGGSRAGLVKYIDGQVDGNHPIQHMTSIVTVSGEALGYVFDGQVFEDDGLTDYGPDGFANLPAGPLLGGGGGYQPSASFQDNRPILTVAADDLNMPPDGTQTTVRVTAVQRGDGSPVGGLTIELLTDPIGRPGDAENQTTSFAGGEAAFLVSDTTQEDVTYTARATTASQVIADAENSVTISYGGIQFVQANGSGFSSGHATAPLAYSGSVTAGNLLVVVVATFGPLTITVADSQGNSFTQAGGTYSNASSAGLSVWYGFAGSTGGNTVTVSGLAGQPASVCLLEYSGAAASPLDGFAKASGSTGTAWAAGSVAVNVAQSVVLGCFAQGFWNTSLVNSTAGSGFTLRYENKDSIVEMQLVVEDLLGATFAVNPGITVDVTDLPWAAIGVSFKP